MRAKERFLKCYGAGSKSFGAGESGVLGALSVASGGLTYLPWFQTARIKANQQLKDEAMRRARVLMCYEGRSRSRGTACSGQNRHRRSFSFRFRAAANPATLDVKFEIIQKLLMIAIGLQYVQDPAR